MKDSHRTALSLVFCVSLAPWLVQCDSSDKSAPQTATPPKPGRVTAPPAEAVTIEVRADGLAYRPGDATPFTGEAVELHPDITPAVALWRTPYVDGKKHGAVTRWSPKGKRMEERHYDHGTPKRAFSFHSNGEKKIQVTLNAQDKAEGPYLRWHDNGSIHVESNYDSEERFHGEEKSYDLNGELVAHYRLEHGKFIEVIFETPKQKDHRLAHWAALEAAQKDQSDPNAIQPPKEEDAKQE